jgi:hypothetical protein
MINRNKIVPNDENHGLLFNSIRFDTRGHQGFAKEGECEEASRTCLAPKKNLDICADAADRGLRFECLWYVRVCCCLSLSDDQCLVLML